MSEPSISILVPTMGRAHKLADLLENIHTATDQTRHQVIFIIEDHDTDSRDAIVTAGTAMCVVNTQLPHVSGKNNYAGALNCGYQQAEGSFIFTGSDDLWFTDCWEFPALETLRSETVQVSGTNDLGNPAVLAGLSATSYLMTADYIAARGGVADQPPGVVLFEGYYHNYTDTEFVATAKSRGVFAPCLESVVEHRHHVFGKNSMDPTYAKTGDPGWYQRDGQLFDSRRHLWERMESL